MRRVVTANVGSSRPSDTNINTNADTYSDTNV